MLNQISRTYLDNGTPKWIRQTSPYVSPKGDQYKRSWWQCRCGKLFIARHDKVNSGWTKSCGCLWKALAKTINRTHGASSNGSETRTYTAWVSMKRRCSETSYRNYRLWGGRGITVCSRWKQFENFLEDMGECPPKMELDRWPDKDGNYRPGNCRWATAKEQNRNTSSNRVFTVRGKTACLSELCDHFGMKYDRVSLRVARHWPIELALFAPIRYRPRKDELAG